MANNNLAVRLAAETLRSLAFGSISGTYAGIGTALVNPCRIIHITNTTDVVLTYSFDGINDNFIVVANGFILLDIMTNKSENGGSWTISAGQRIYVKGSPSTGSTYLAAFYGSNLL